MRAKARVPRRIKRARRTAVKPLAAPLAYEFKREEFWKDPAASGAPAKRIKTCRPEFYLELEHVTRLVVGTLERYADKDDTILEIGCGTGRNLVGLQAAGFQHVSGIEISEKTVAVGWERFPAYRDIQVLIGPAEKMISEIEKVDVIFTSGLLMHIPPEHEWIFAQIAKKAKKVIMTNEGEAKEKTSEHAWNRNYKEIFEGLGWQEVEMEPGENYPPQAASTVKRVFVKARRKRAVQNSEAEL